MTSLGKWAPLKLIAIVVLPHDVPLLTAGDHTVKIASKNLRQNHRERSTIIVRSPQVRDRLFEYFGYTGVHDPVIELCCALHNFRVCLTPWQSIV
jgi:hypothetical protein